MNRLTDLLEKAVWSNEDFAQMGWHDANIWAIAFLEPDVPGMLGELALDIDYIVQWIEPSPPDEYFSFAVAPATLVFHDVWEARGDFAAFDVVTFEIDSIQRGDPEDEQQREQNVRRWTIEGGVNVTVVAAGFHQYFRSRPIGPRGGQRLTLEERGGVSFARPTSFEPRS